MNNIEYKKKLFCNRIDNFIEIPDELKNKLSESFLDSSTYLLPIQDPSKHEEKQVLINEIGRILDELEIFEREKRKIKLVLLMEKIAECLDDDSITEEELTDRLFYGNRVCVIEKEFIKKRGTHGINYFNNQMCATLNNILEDDDKITLTKRKKYRRIIGSRRCCHHCNLKALMNRYVCKACQNIYHKDCINSKMLNGKRICLNCINNIC
jgi:hypothetical protein